MGIMIDILEAIKNRRSIRHYRSDPVPETSLQTVLEAAHWAPSWGNTQCWRFIVVRESETRSKIADTVAKVKIDNEWLENAAAIAIRQAPILIVICAEMGRAGFRSDNTPVTDKGDYWYLFDIALAMENLVLAAHSLGLGTVIIGGFDASSVGKILDVPPDYNVVTMTPLGIPDHMGQVSPRKNLAEVTYKEKYGGK
jgi:nitroreductase